MNARGARASDAPPRARRMHTAAAGAPRAFAAPAARMRGTDPTRTPGQHAGGCSTP